MGKAPWVVVLAILAGSSLIALDGADFTGRWILESPSQPSPDIPGALSVRQSLVRTNVRGEPITPFFKDITIEREVGGRTRSETHQIGVMGGFVSGLASGGSADGLQRHHAVRWDANALVFESGSYTGGSPETGVWEERREVWSLDPDGRLHVTVATRSSVDSPKTVVLVYRRP
jgi:hypothetical protein